MNAKEITGIILMILGMLGVILFENIYLATLGCAMSIIGLTYFSNA